MADDAEQMEYRIGKLAMAPGDVLVVKTSAVCSAAGIESLVKYVGRAVPAGCNMLVIDGTIDLSILTRAEIESRVSEGTAP